MTVDPAFRLRANEREYDCAVQRNDGSFSDTANYILTESQLHPTRESATGEARKLLIRDRDVEIAHINRMYDKATKELNDGLPTDRPSD